MPNMAPQYQQPQKKYLGMAIAAFVVSFFSGLIGLIIAIMAQVKLSKEKGRYKGQGLNIAAFVISGINLVLSIILSVAFTSGVLQGTREALEGSAASSSQTRSHHDAHSERSKDQGADSGKADSQSAGRYADVQAWVDAHPENFKDFHDADGQLTSKVTGQGNDTLMIDMTTQADFNGQIDDATKAKIDEQMGKAVSIMVPAIEQDVIQLRAAGFPNAVAKVVVHIGSTYSYNATVDDKGMVQS
ncbi:hypothetical protein BBOMB_1403 [Bifidobacterium bombi DSM 19703]|uniref:DUF4190 domain-containing protein n=2 Tax=Bifidobacterium bombi TaxID=471511 RepID=A0A086BNN4_9BIFI|nr:hypothetical protein BBOMB_1403 [Bifidobacterium bombi DSM 19703]